MRDEATKNFLEINVTSKSFPGQKKNFEVLKEISLTIPQGSATAFLGPSGCGKTTLLRIISGLDKKFDGSIKIEGRRPTKEDARKFGFVFQESNLLPWKNVGENISFFCDLLGKKSDLDKTIEAVGLSGFEKHYPHQLSGGMQKRVSLARSLATEPKILFMDEPFESLDEFTRQRMRQLLLKFWGKFRTTIILVTHNIEEAILLSDKVIVLSGKPTTILTAYDTAHIKHKQNQEYLSVLDKIYKDFGL